MSLKLINKEMPFNGLRWFFDHAETISEENLDRVKALGGGIAIQDPHSLSRRIFIQRYGKKAASYAPPINNNA